MGLFEKIEFEAIEPDNAEVRPSTRQWHGETLTIVYPLWRKLLAILFALILLPMCQAFLVEGFFLFEIIIVAGVAIGIWYLGDSLLTREIVFAPDRIVKKWYFGQVVLPVDSLVLKANEQSIRLYHRSTENIREAVLVQRQFISTEEGADLCKYADDVYQVSANAVKWAQNPVVEFRKAVSSYRAMAAFFFIYAIIAIIVEGFSVRFIGFAPGLPAFPLRLAASCLALAVFFLLHRLSPTTPPVTAGTAAPDQAAVQSAVAVIGVAGLGLLLFLLFGNALDFYMFQSVGVLYFFDFYPRLSSWQEALQESIVTIKSVVERQTMPRRSLHVSLVLLGTLAVTSYGESNHYLYKSRQDCLDDWGDGKDCREAPASKSYHRSFNYYGPRYEGSLSKPAKSVGIGTVNRGGFGSLGNFHASFSG